MREWRRLVWVLFFMIVSAAHAENRIARRYVASADANTAPDPTAVQVSEPSWWSPEKARYSIGYEYTGNIGGIAQSPLPQNAVALGMWLSPDIGVELLVGYNHGADNATTSTNTAVDPNAQTSNVTTTYSGTMNATSVLLGGILKYRAFQNSWFQFNLGAMVAVVPGDGTSVNTGTTTVSTPNTTQPTTFSTTDTNIGTVSTNTNLAVSVGPRLGTEFYLKWVPHLALGFETGVLTTFGGQTTTTTSTQSDSFNTTNGTAGTKTVSGTTTNVVTTKPGTVANTFGAGGLAFQLTGAFTLRYIF